MAELEDVWIPLVDEPIGSIVTQIVEETPEIAQLVDSPRRILAFRTFAYIRVGLLLGQLLVEHDIDEYDGSETWIESILRDPSHHDAVAREIRAVAEEVAADERLAAEESMGPDDDARERFRAFARQQLGA
jgi:hypothetical protein